MFTNAVDVVQCGQQRGEHVNNAVLAALFAFLVHAIAVVDELRTFALQRFQVFGGFFLRLAQWGQGTVLVMLGVVRLGCGLVLLFTGSRLVGRRLGRCGGIGLTGCACGRSLLGVVVRCLAGLVGCLLAVERVDIRQVLEVIVLVEVGHYLLSFLSSSSSTTSASTTSSSEDEAAPEAWPAAPAPAAPAAPSAPCWAYNA